MNLDILEPVVFPGDVPTSNRGLSFEAWKNEQDALVVKVKLFREYMAGDHRAELSTEMIEMLRIDSRNASRFNDNYCTRVVYAMSDRCTVDRIESDTDAGNAWVGGLLDASRFDGLQTNVIESSLIDGNAYTLTTWDEATGQSMLISEPAYNGTSGMMVLHDAFGKVETAVKVWKEADDTRVTVYFRDRIRRYIGQGDGVLEPYEPDGIPFETMQLLKGEPLGCPVTHYPNRWVVGSFYGLSELEQVIPLQDSLNRTLTSLIMASELTAFQVKVALGFKPPAALTPGCIVTIDEGDTMSDVHEPKMYVLETGQVIPYIQAADWLVGQIGRVSDTPMPEGMGGDNASGESLKQREIGLLGKVSRYHVRTGNKWEDAVMLAHRLETIWSTAAPAPVETLDCQWAPAEIRNDTEVIANAKVLDDMGYPDEALRQMAPVYGWDEAKIQQLLEEKQATQAQDFTRLTRTFDTFDNDIPINLGA